MRKALGLPHSHWWIPIDHVNELRQSDEIFIDGVWKPFWESGITIFEGDHYAYRRRIARPMYAFKMREIINNSPLINKKVIK